MEQYYGWYPGSVNNTGQISGHAWSDEGLSAVVWNPLPDGKGWKVQKLECSADYPFCSASGINDKGEIVGFGVSPDWSSHIAVMWKPLSNDSRTWAITELASLPANPSYIGANSLNNLGEIIGSGADQNGNWVATRWNDRDPGTVKLLGFPSAPGLANRVNNFGVAIGTYSSTTCGWCAAAIEIQKGRK
jgi:uncharacterized membrane protein